MILAFFWVFEVFGYQETLTFIPIDQNTLSVFNFSDRWAGQSSVFVNLGTFPLSIVQILEETESFAVNFA
jgi:hypothetical protein